MTTRTTAVQSAVATRVPAGGQVSSAAAGLTALLAPTSCSSFGGISIPLDLVGASGVLDLVGSDFLGWWCPWRPIVGILVVLGSGFAAVRAGLRVVELHS